MSESFWLLQRQNKLRSRLEQDAFGLRLLVGAADGSVGDVRESGGCLRPGPAAEGGGGVQQRTGIAGQLRCPKEEPLPKSYMSDINLSI